VLIPILYHGRSTAICPSYNFYLSSHKNDEPRASLYFDLRQITPAAKVGLEGQVRLSGVVQSHRRLITAQKDGATHEVRGNRSDVVDKCSTCTWLRLADRCDGTRYKGASRQSKSWSPLLLVAFVVSSTDRSADGTSAAAAWQFRKIKTSLL